MSADRLTIGPTLRDRPSSTTRSPGIAEKSRVTRKSRAIRRRVTLSLTHGR